MNMKTLPEHIRNSRFSASQIAAMVFVLWMGPLIGAGRLLKHFEVQIGYTTYQSLTELIVILVVIGLVAMVHVFGPFYVDYSRDKKK